jgi:hypothetical protein
MSPFACQTLNGMAGGDGCSCKAAQQDTGQQVSAGEVERAVGANLALVEQSTHSYALSRARLQNHLPLVAVLQVVL